MGKIKALIIDDSALIRKMLREVFDDTDDIEVVGVASDPLIGLASINGLLQLARCLRTSESP